MFVARLIFIVLLNIFQIFRPNATVNLHRQRVMRGHTMECMKITIEKKTYKQ